jgi:hypothetical protein
MAGLPSGLLPRLNCTPKSSNQFRASREILLLNGASLFSLASQIEILLEGSSFITSDIIIY